MSQLEPIPDRTAGTAAPRSAHHRFTTALALLALLGAPSLAWSQADGPRVVAATPEAAGRYLVIIGDCNGCHTPRFAETNGAEPPESAWLTGVPVGFRGPWGVSYPSNLRLSVQTTDEDAWVATMRHRTGLPPMPWSTLSSIREEDVRAIYRYIRSLGPAGDAMPASLPPGAVPTTPVFEFVPVMVTR